MRGAGLLRQFVGFAGVGVIGTGAHYVVLIALVQYGRFDSVPSSAAGFTVGAFVNYYLNYHLTFGSQKKHREAMAKFFTVALLGLALNTLVMAVLSGSMELHYLVSQIAATGLVLVWNFAGNRFWTFKEAADVESR